MPFTLSETQSAAGKKGDKTRLVVMEAEHDMIGMFGLPDWTDPKRSDIPTEMPTEIVFGARVFMLARVHSEPLD